MKLYHHPLSGHSHRARLFLSLINLPHELVEVDLMSGAHKTPDFLKMNPFGQVPVLDDDGEYVSDSNAILVYLAKKAGRTDWLPDDLKSAAAVQRWLSVAAGEIAYGPAAARLVTVFGAKFNPGEVIARAHAVLGKLETQLSDREWLVGERPTIADVASTATWPAPLKATWIFPLILRSTGCFVVSKRFRASWTLSGLRLALPPDPHSGARRSVPDPFLGELT